MGIGQEGFPAPSACLSSFMSLFIIPSILCAQHIFLFSSLGWRVCMLRKRRKTMIIHISWGQMHIPSQVGFEANNLLQ